MMVPLKPTDTGPAGSAAAAAILTQSTSDNDSKDDLVIQLACMPGLTRASSKHCSDNAPPSYFKQGTIIISINLQCPSIW